MIDPPIIINLLCNITTTVTTTTTSIITSRVDGMSYYYSPLLDLPIRRPSPPNKQTVVILFNKAAFNYSMERILFDVNQIITIIM